MVRGKLSNFENLVRQRGYTMQQVQPCVVAIEDGYVTVDNSHDAFPHASRCRPGAELKSLLLKLGITSSPKCSCNRKAEAMNKNGCDWCELNIDEIVGWLREEATTRRLPFIDVAGRILVRRAISNARRKATS